MSNQSGKVHLAILSLIVCIAAVIGGILLLVTGMDAEGPQSPRVLAGIVIVFAASIAGAAVNMLVLLSGQNGRAIRRQYSGEAK